ncbi:MAG TPA: 3'(2'),5'-bisphosphate nucleotidase CysQ [Acidimicrobiales bacterium]|nr:3'(2'),5'-bisphosphate nucleotidase CysQ [Acidimicrobiales bacterium]
MTGSGHPRVTQADHDRAAELARQAGEVLLTLRKRIGDDLTADQARDQGDKSSHELLAAAITELFPDDGLLSEEGKDSSERLGRERVWIVDPLDGTREFGEPGRDDWAVHVALSVAHEAVVGAVALPARSLVLSTCNPPSAPARPSVDEELRVVVSRTRPPQSAERLSELLGARMVPMGSAGAKAMAVVLGDADIYFHAGGQYEWDSAAPVAVAASAGLHVSRTDGSPLRYNQANPWLPDLLICRKDLAERVLDGLAQVLA